MDTETKLNQLEAGRVKTEFETKYGVKIKYRVLVGYSPKEVADRLTTVKVKAEEVAKAAGR